MIYLKVFNENDGHEETYTESFDNDNHDGFYNKYDLDKDKFVKDEKEFLHYSELVLEIIKHKNFTDIIKFFGFTQEQLNCCNLDLSFSLNSPNVIEFGFVDRDNLSNCYNDPLLLSGKIVIRDPRKM